MGVLLTERPAFVAAAAGCVLLVVQAAAQAPQPTPDSKPQATFQLEVNHVAVDVSVTDQQGNSVAGLAQDDFAVAEDGAVQKIDTFSYLDIPVAGPEPFPGVDTPVSTDVRSNLKPLSGRMYVIVLDDANVSSLRSALVKQEARRFVESYFGAGDVAAVAYTSGRTDGSQDLTSDRQLLLAAIDRFIGQRSRSAALEAADKCYAGQALAGGMQNGASNGATESQAGNANQGASQTGNQSQNGKVSQSGTDCQGADQIENERRKTLGSGASVDIDDFARSQRAIAVLDKLRALADALSAVPGRRKALIMFSEGIDYQMSFPFGMRSVTDVLRATQDAITAAARSNVTFFTIDPRGLAGMTSEFMQMRRGIPETTQAALMDEFRTSQDSLRTLAEETGGFAALTSNSFASAFDRIVNHDSRYYVLGYSAPTHPADGKFHQIDVRVTRPGLKVMARRGYASPRKDEAARRASDARRPGANNTSSELRDLLDSPIQRGGLSFSVQAAPFRNSDKDASVALSIEIEGDRLAFAPPAANGTVSNKVELSFFGIDENGKAGTGTRQEINLSLKPETYEAVRAHGIRLNPRMTLAPGRYQLRIGAREAVGSQTGSVFYDLVVPDFRKETLAMSGLLLSAASAQQTPTAAPDPVAGTLLPGAATSRREFPVGDKLALYAEVYDNSSAPEPRHIDVTVRLISEDGDNVFAADESLASPHSEPSDISAELVLEDLTPGRYLLRVQAKRSGSDSTVVTRETLITVVP